MLQVIEEMTMPGGWNYIQKLPTGIETTIESDTFNNLLDAVLNFRLHNKIEPGNWREDIVGQICSRYPHQCQMGSMYDAVPQKQFPPGPPRFIDHIITWAQSLQGNPATANLEYQHEAERRAEICRRCPLKIEWENSCAKCVSHANTMLFAIRKGRDVVHQRDMGACKVLRHENGTAVWLKKELLQRGPMDQLPNHCWVK